MGLCRLHADIKLIIWNAGEHTTFRSDFIRLAQQLRQVTYVRFAPESGHVRCNLGCPLRAKSGHGQTTDSMTPPQWSV